MTACVAVLAPAAAPAPAAAAAPDRLEAAVIRGVNQARVAYGLPRVHHSGRLAGVADRHTAEQLATGRLSHVAADGSTVLQRLRGLTRGPVGEVIAWTGGAPTSARAIVSMWLNSPAHRAVILDRRFRRIGLGARRGSRGPGSGVLVTADFARR